MHLRNQHIFKQKKRKFKYNPAEKYKESETKYTFPNISGNIINKISNFRVLNDEYVDKITNFDDSEDDNSEDTT